MAQAAFIVYNRHLIKKKVSDKNIFLIDGKIAKCRPSFLRHYI